MTGEPAGRVSGDVPGRDDHGAEGLVALRDRLDARMVLEVQVDDLALGGRHGLERDGVALARDLLRRAVGQRLSAASRRSR